jgi:plastocyanin
MRSTDDGYGSAYFSFAPSSVRITRGGTVTWSHEGGSAVHNVTFSAAAGAPANVDNLSSGSASRTFNSIGAFSYRCSNHEGMRGSSTV